MNGKGSKQRPSSVHRDQFANNWDQIFNKHYIGDVWYHDCDEKDGETVTLRMGLQCPNCGVSYE